MDPPPLSTAPPIPTTAAPPQTTAAATPATTQNHVNSYPDSVESSPRSRNTDSWDEPPYGPTTTAAHPATTAKLRLMCSYGGHIVPRPHDKSLCYVGGDTRIVVADRNTNLSDFLLRLSKTVLAGKSFSLKYQLPNEDLDSLITVTTDEDFENMVEEYDRLHKNPCSKNSRLRLFLFSTKSELETSSSIESLLEHSSKSSEWFFNALNATTPSCKNRAFSETSSVNCLLGLDDAMENQNPAVKDVDAQLDSITKRDGSGGGIPGKVNNNLSTNYNNNGNLAQDVHSVPDSPMLETSSSFGSTSSSPSTTANLPPIKVGSDEGSNHQKGVAGLGIEEQFAQVTSVSKPEDGGFTQGMASPPAPVSVPVAAFSGLPVVVGGEYQIPYRNFPNDERSELGVGFKMGAQVQPLQQQQQVQQFQQQPQQQLHSAQLQQSKPTGAFDLPSPDSVSSDGSVTNPLSRQKPMMYHEAVVQVQSVNGRVAANQIDPKTTELNNRVQVPQQVQESGYALPSQFDQYQQVQYVPAGAQYMHHHPPGAMPMYYPMYPPQQVGHHPPSMEHQYPVYLVPARQAQGYNIPMQQPSFSESTPIAPSSRPQTSPSAALVPPTAFTPATNATAAAVKPELPAAMYRTSAAGQPHLVHVPSSQSPQYAGFSQIHHPSQSIAPSSATTTTASYAYEYADPTHAQIYYTQPMPPHMATQYQTMTSAPPLKSSDTSTQIPSENMKQQVRTSQP
ncbi:OLC1v1032207C1 [Oldenlandia corymbosa var. corymbosa]|uniref:OLC1v1032207C1 n=1 Tax=Oldenlandia corymbosa var. corymbosa TaxID=529605 RepID=A0AAV1CL26_OLDCO|nr:OLC1v1032207C1 [Oldenlandia corymbosa var. corymbosa]